MKNFIYFLVVIALLPFLAMADGDNFSPTKELSGERAEYYVNSFNYTMETAKANIAHDWKTNGAVGKIIASEKYLSKSQSVCRNYTESFEIDGKKNTNLGVACKRTNDVGWCRMKADDAHTCAIEKPQGTVDKMLSGVGNSAQKAKGWLGF
jgi:hypothetical protein